MARKYTDLWFHGDCLFWAWGLLLKGNHITGLEEHLQDYWKQVCHYCHKWGASIGCAEKGCSKVYHYSCGVAKGCLFREQNLSSWCNDHVESARRFENSILGQ